MSSASVVLSDSELVDLLRDEPELLALSDAYAATQGEHWRRGRARTRAKRASLVAAVAAAIAIPAAAFADQIGGLVGLYNSSPPVPSSAFPAYQVGALARIWAFGNDEVRKLDERAGVTFYGARNAAGSFCLGIGLAATPSIDALTCEGSGNSFPSSAEPIADFSSIDANGDTTTVTRLAGFANDSVMRIAILATDGSTIASTPVVNDIYASDQLPPEPASEIVAYDATGAVVFRRSLSTTPNPQPITPNASSTKP
jgi:hypothetical protein